MCFKCLVWCTPVKKKCRKTERALEICDIRSISSSSSSNLRGRHLSKSASELSCSPRCEEMTEIRPRSAAPPEHTHISVYQKAHSFFAQLKNRWGHGKHRERRHKSPGRQDSTTDYAADQSSDHSTPSTQSPRHRLHQTACTDSPLSRVCVGDTPHSSPGGSPRPRAPTPGAVAGLDLIPVTSSDDVVRRRETALRQHSFFQLRIHLRRGHGLVAMDKNGTSDPYVKFKLGGRLVYKSRTVYRDLNPTWDESFTVPIEDPFIPLQIKVFDYDWGLQDDFMGSCQLELTSLELGRMMDISISLQDPSKVGASLGEISLTVTLYPKTQEDKEQIYDDKMFDLTSTSRIRRKIKTKVVTFGNRIQSSKVFGSFQDLSILDKDKIRERVRKFKCSSSDIDDYDSDDGNRNVVLDGRSLSISQFAIKSRLTLDVVRDAGDEDRTDVTGATDKNLLGRLGDRCQNQFQRMKFLLYPTPIYADTSQNWTNNFFTYCEDYGIDSDVESIEYCDAIKRYEQYEQVIPILYNPPVPSFISGDYDPYFQKTTKVSDVNKRLKSQIWSSVVTIVVIEGKNLLACDPETGTSDPYVKFRLGNEKYKTRVIWRSLNPRWLEQFDLHLYDDGDQQLEITVWDKDRSRDDFIGRTSIDLSSLEREKTHSIWARLEDAAGTLNLLLTISGTTASETISDLTSHEDNPMEKEILLNRYAWHRTFHNIKDVGHLTVKVFRATGLAAADLGGKSDPFCVLELGNARLQTQTEYKTLSPSWQKIFTFNVKDINNVLDVTVYDEDRDHKVEFLGKIAIPLLRIKNGEKRWYALKDKKLRSRAKGSSPQILLEMSVIWNPIRACIRTLNPKEEKYMQTEIKFKRQVFVKNVLRLKVIVMHFYEYGKILQSCFEWESTFQSFVALVFFLILCYYFEPWMIPIAGLLIFLKQYIVKQITGPQTVPWDEVADSDLDDDEEDDKEKEEKKSLKERLQAIQEVTQGVQNAIGRLATFGESVKNTFNFTVPYLSWIAVFLLVATCLVLYFIPIRYLLMLWGMNKFFRRILRPHSVPNNELLDLVSRVPDNEMLLDYKDLKILLATEPEKRREPRKKHKVS